MERASAPVSSYNDTMSPCEENTKRWRIRSADILFAITGVGIWLGAWQATTFLPRNNYGFALAWMMGHGGLFVIGGTVGAIIRRLWYGLDVGLAKGFWIGGCIGIILPYILYGLFLFIFAGP